MGETSTKRVLIVDDEMDMRIFLSTVFDTGGFRAITAREGGEGFRKAQENSPHLIVLDIMMPGEGGVQMYRRLKADEALRRTPVLMLSGVARNTFFHYLKMMRIHQETGIPEPDGYLEKPPKPEELLRLAHSLTQPGS